MSLNRTKVWLTTWVLTFLMGSSVLAQGVRDMSLFAPADLSTYGGGLRPREGLFFNADFLYWGITPPKRTSIPYSSRTEEMRCSNGASNQKNMCSCYVNIIHS